MSEATWVQPPRAAGPLPPAWRRGLVALGVVLTGLVVLHFETLRVMEGVWSGSETFTHAYIVPVICLWLVWRLRATLADKAPRPCLWWLLPMALVEVLWFAGDLMLVNTLTQFAVVALMVLAVPLLLGTDVARTLLFPLAFLFFAVPFGDFLLPWLMEWTADFTVAALSLSGIPVYREGLQFVIPTGNWSVVEACSGIRYLIASLMVGSLFAYLNYNSPWRRWAFVVVSLVVPILANWVRAYLIVMVGHLSSNRLAVGVDHLIYGWVFFGVVITLMFMVGARWAEPELPPARRPGPAEAAVASAGWTWLAAVAGLLVAVVAHGSSWAMERSERAATQPILALPAQLGPAWPGTASPPRDGWVPTIHRPRATASATYGTPQDAVDLHVGYFRAQDWDSKLVSSMHAVVKGEDTTWNVAPAGALSLDWRGTRVEVPLVHVRPPPRLGAVGSGSLLVARLYWVDGDFAVSATHTKVLGALARVRGRGDDGAIVMFAAPGTDIARQHANLQRALADGLAELDRALADVRARR